MLRDIGDARLVLDKIIAGAPDDAVAPLTVSGTQSTSTAARALPWAVAALSVVIVGWTLWSRTGLATPALRVTHLEIGHPRDVEPAPSLSTPPAISSDGRIVAMIGVKDGVRRVFVRRLDRATVTEIPDTAGATGVVFSPDGGSLAVLFTSGLITRIALADQQRKVLVPGADAGLSITWSRAGIIFSRVGALWIIPPEGGTPRALTVLQAARHELMHDAAVVLPGERLVLFSSQTTDPGDDRIESVSIDGGPRSVVLERARTPVWSPTGHLLFARDGAMLAVPFDTGTGSTRGTAIPIMPAGAIESTSSSQMALSLTATGTLLSMPAGFTDTRIVSVGRDGSARALDSAIGPLQKSTDFARWAPTARRKR